MDKRLVSISDLWNSWNYLTSSIFVSWSLNIFIDLSFSILLQQTNTADMLEEAVEYVKFLQKQIQVLN